MNLYDMINYLRECFSNASYLDQKYSFNFRAETIYDVEITISYPGYKATSFFCDYVVWLNNQFGNRNLSHVDIMNEFYESASNDNQNIELYNEFLIDISKYWEEIDLSKYSRISFPTLSKEEMLEVICYIAAQEEMNYPSRGRCLGYKRPFYSYLEAINAASSTPDITIEEALDRGVSRGSFEKIPTFNIPYSRIGN